jgi:hypothetical protein
LEHAVLKRTAQAKKKKREPEYIKGPEARRNFEAAMKALFRSPKPKKGKA